MNLRNEHPRLTELAVSTAATTRGGAVVGRGRSAARDFERGGPRLAVFDALIALDRHHPRHVEELAVSVGLEAHDLRRALRARTYQRIAIACRQQAIARGVAQSPAVFLNGALLDGELDDETLRWKFLDARDERTKAQPAAAAADPGLMPTAPPTAQAPMTITLRGVLIRYEGARNAPRGLRRTRAQARLRAEKLTARAMMPGADFADLGLRFGDQLLDPETTAPRPDDALSTAVALLGINEVCSPVECDEGYYVAQRMA